MRPYGLEALSQLTADVVRGGRACLTHPIQTALVVASIAVGIGANVAVDSLFGALLSRRLAVRSPESLYHIYIEEPNTRQLLGATEASYEVLRGGQADIEEPLAFRREMASFRYASRVGSVAVDRVSSNYFSVLGVRAARGRLLGSGDDRAQGAVVISHTFWTRDCQRADVIGSQIEVSGQMKTIVGIAAPAFEGLLNTSLVPTAMWLPLDRSDAGSEAAMRRDLHLAVRWTGSRPIESAGLRVEQALAHVQSLVEQDAVVRRVVFVRADSVSVGPTEDRRLSVLAAVGRGLSAILFLGVCLNLANAFLARTTSRLAEIAIRLALGASRTRLVTQFAAEYFVPIGVGALIGLTAGYGAAGAIAAVVNHARPLDLPSNLRITLAAHNVLVAVCLLAFTGLVCGVLPALRVVRRTALGAQASQGATPRPLLHWLILPQVGISLVLVFVAASLVQSLMRSRIIDLGYRADGGAFVAVDFSPRTISGQRRSELMAHAVERVRHVPGVAGATLSDWPLMGDQPVRVGVTPLGSSVGPGNRIARCHRVGDQFFSLAGVRVIRGHTVNPDDSRAGPRSVLLDERTAGRYWPGKDPIGQLIRLDFGQLLGDPRNQAVAEVVGIVQNVRDMPVGEQERDRVYIGATSDDWATMNVFFVATPGAEAVSAVRDAVQRYDSSLLVTAAMSMSEYVDRMFLPQQTMSLVMLVMGLAGTIITGLGVFAVVQQAVSSRRREMAIRLCLGAPRFKVTLALAGKSAVMVFTGASVGLALALASTNAVSRLTFGMPLELWAVAISLSFVLSVGAVSCAIPAMSGTAGPPVRWLRQE